MLHFSCLLSTQNINIDFLFLYSVFFYIVIVVVVTCAIIPFQKQYDSSLFCHRNICARLAVIFVLLSFSFIFFFFLFLLSQWLGKPPLILFLYCCFSPRSMSRQYESLSSRQRRLLCFRYKYAYHISWLCHLISKIVNIKSALSTFFLLLSFYFFFLTKKKEKKNIYDSGVERGGKDGKQEWVGLYSDPPF